MNEYAAFPDINSKDKLEIFHASLFHNRHLCLFCYTYNFMQRRLDAIETTENNLIVHHVIYYVLLAVCHTVDHAGWHGDEVHTAHY